MVDDKTINKFLEENGFCSNFNKNNKLIISRTIGKSSLFSASGKTPIVVAAEKGLWDIVIFFVKDIIDYQTTNKDSDADFQAGRALLIAFQSKEFIVAKKILKIKHLQKYYVIEKNSEELGYSSLHYAILYNQLDLLEKLFRKGFHPNYIHKYNDSIFYGTMLEKRTLYSKSAFELALDLENWDAIILLIENGANVYSVSSKNLTVIELAAINQKWDLVEDLLEIKRFINGECVDDISKVVFYATKYNNIDIIRKISDLKVKITDIFCFKGKYSGYGSLHFAVFNHNLEMINLILNMGVDVNAAYKSENNKYISVMDVAIKQFKEVEQKTAIIDIIVALIKENSNISPLLTIDYFNIDNFVKDVIELSLSIFTKDCNRVNLKPKTYQISAMSNLELSNKIKFILLHNEKFLRKIYLVPEDHFYTDSFDISRKDYISALGINLSKYIAKAIFLETKKFISSEPNVKCRDAIDEFIFDTYLDDIFVTDYINNRESYLTDKDIMYSSRQVEDYFLEENYKLELASIYNNMASKNYIINAERDEGETGSLLNKKLYIE